MHTQEYMPSSGTVTKQFLQNVFKGNNQAMYEDISTWIFLI